ncbi:MAG: Polygalacturonase 2 [Stictis urceolatum]|nr:Polygalacturonase 2 [Stictis urceolata]
MFSSTFLNILAGFSALAAAVPAPVADPNAVPLPTPAPEIGDRLEKRASCIFTAASAVSASKKSCATIVVSGITVPSGTTLDLTKLNDGTHVIFEGTTTFGYKEWEGPLVSVSGTDISVTGASGHVIDGNGAKWWDGEGSNGGKTKPKFFYAHSMTNSLIDGLNVKNTPVQGFSINGASNLTLNGITIDNSAGDGSNGGHNTDAFDVGSSDGVTISGANVKNQDDCLAINSGSNIIFTGGTCSGGHGLSIGSVGGRSDNDVENVTIENSSVSNSENGIRIKTVYDATGSVKGVTFKDIKLSGITKYGIVFEQDYENGSPTGTPTTGVPITDLTVSSVTGSVGSSATDIYILCGKGSCSDWTWSGVSITGGKKSSTCSNVPSVASC